MFLRNVETGEDFPEVLTKVKFSSVAWTHDHAGIFYGCYPDHDLDKASGRDTAAQVLYPYISTYQYRRES